MDTMLLKQMLVAPTTTSGFVVFDPFQDVDHEALVKEVIGVANAEVDGPRYILFGVNPGGSDDKKIVGLSDTSLTALKRAHRFVSSLVEPALDLAFIFDRIDGKLVGALEVDGCDFGPYFVALDLNETLYRGASWRRNGRDLVETNRHELLPGRDLPATELSAVTVPDEIRLSVGFDDDPDCEYIDVEVPDSSAPPFAEDGRAEGDTRKSATIAQSLKETVSAMTTQMLNIGRSNKAAGSESHDADDTGRHIAEAARKHYFYEECAVKIDLCIRNDNDVDIENLAVEIGVPRISGFDVADRIYTSPFDKRAAEAARKIAYPDVEYRRDAIFIRTTIASLKRNDTQALFDTPLRLAIGPKATGRKLGLQYVLRTADGRRVGDGRLKIRLGKRAAQPGVETAKADSKRAADA